jgi:predicted nuclease of restriction endonuclease-like (RecB) superfamily
MPFDPQFLDDLKSIWLRSRRQAFSLVNTVQIGCYWEIGRRITQEEQKGNVRADYGTFLLRELAAALAQDLGKALDERELRKIRQFYQCFPDQETVRTELTWTHYRLLLRIDDYAARIWYVKEAADQGWSSRQLERNIQTGYYHRILTTQQSPAALPASHIATLRPDDLIKDPYILEFLGVPPLLGYNESDLESALLSKIQQFLLELGKGFAFVARQYAIKTDTRLFYIDLVFYNYVLKCFCLAELKTGPLGHADIGQIDMYVRLFDALKRQPGDNPTIGLILCTDKDETMVKYSVLDENKQLFASTYRFILPSEEALRHEIDREQQHFRRLN